MSFSVFICFCFYVSFAVASLVPVPANSVIPSQNVTFSDAALGLSQSSNRTSATALNKWPPAYPGYPYIYTLDPPDPSGLDSLAFTKYGRTGGPKTFDLLLTLLGQTIQEVERWAPGSHLEGEVRYRLTERSMVLTVAGFKPFVQGYGALTKDVLIAVVEALRSCVSAYGSREFIMVPLNGRPWARIKLGILRLEGPFPDNAE